MNIRDTEKPIIATWGIGPAARRRVKLHISQSISSGYEHIMDYAILTDAPEEFEEIARETGKIKLITDIHEVRKNYEWSIEKEPISKYKDYENYAKDWLELFKQNKQFSYALHRYQLPDLAKNGYKKILFIDADMKINYQKIGVDFSEEYFWNEFDTPVNQLKGCIAEKLGIFNSTEFKWSSCIGSSISAHSLQGVSIFLYLLEQKFKKNKFFIPVNFSLTEGPFRYYNFESTDKVNEYFEFWEEAQKIALSNPQLTETLGFGGYMNCDYSTVAAANIYSQLTIENFNNIIYDIELHYEDRYFLPRLNTASCGFPIKPANSMDEFFEINKESYEKALEHNVWPNVDPQVNYKLNN